MNLRRATATREKDSKQTERIDGADSVMIEGIPFMRERKIGCLLASVRECMRWTTAMLYALEHARNPVQCVQKISWTQQED
jgi:hypothetical protein